MNDIKNIDKEIESARRYLDIAEVVFLSLDIEGNVKLINKKGCKILGYSSKEILGRNWFDNFLPKSAVNKVKDVFDKIIQGKLDPVEFYENRVLTKSGKERLIAWHNTRLVDKGGQIVGTLSSGIDLTNQVLAEKRFKQVVESSPNGILMVDKKGKITLVNNQVEKLFGYNNNELVGKSLEMLVPKEYKSKHKQLLKGFLSNPTNRPMGEGRDLYAIRKDGTKFPVEVGLSTIESDGSKGVLASIIDITERKSAEKILHDSEQKLQAILNNNADAILVYNTEGKIVSINKKAKKLFSNNSVKVINIFDIIPSNFIPIHRFQLEQAKSGINLLDYETERINADGRRINVSIALSYISLENGLFIENMRDISERIVIRNNIIDFEKAQIIANMAEGVAHHMGTPLASMLMRVQMLKEDIEEIDEDGKFREKLQSVEKQILYGQKVMQRLLKFASKPISEKQPFNIKHIADDAVEILRPLLTKKSIDLIIDIDKDYSVLADGNMIQLVFSDLIINSIQAIENKGTIKITARHDDTDENLTIKISDTGSGIPEEVIPYVFEPFFTTKAAEQGTGLGLAVAKRIVHEHDGQIRIESKKDEGTDIIINLAIYNGDSKP